MTKRPADDEDVYDEYTSQMELARLLRIELRKMHRTHLPRYQGRARIKNRISLVVRPSTPDSLEIKVSLDIVERWYALTLHNMADPPPPISLDTMKKLRLEVINFRRKATPMLLLRLVEWAPRRYGSKLTKSPKGWLFSARVSASKIGVDPSGGTIKALEIIPWPAVRGHLVILPDTHRAYRARRDDISRTLGSIDPREPPRYRHGEKDPKYLAMLAAEAAERNDQ